MPLPDHQAHLICLELRAERGAACPGTSGTSGFLGASPRPPLTEAELLPTEQARAPPSRQSLSISLPTEPLRTPPPLLTTWHLTDVTSSRVLKTSREVKDRAVRGRDREAARQRRRPLHWRDGPSSGPRWGPTLCATGLLPGLRPPHPVAKCPGSREPAQRLPALVAVSGPPGAVWASCPAVPQEALDPRSFRRSRGS